MPDDGMPEQVVDTCPMCREKSLTLMEKETEVPYFGRVLLFSMTCGTCKYHMADVEALEQKEPTRYTFEIQDEKDMNVRIVKSSEATVKVPHITTIEPGPASQGYVTNIEGLLNRVKYQIEGVKETAEDDEDRTKAKNLLKKIFRVKTGQEKQKIIIEDPSGNSAIISDRAIKEKLKVKANQT
ncbi:TPA: ZPR1 zinc finger domain-containing protein [Candidatus Woesearchaeota archaeon]|nr:ZPR1 zinc finger domain-containing protein [Candidatus Woesearchaeota archaeon]